MMILQEKLEMQDKSQPTRYQIEITDDRLFPKAYNECQKLLEKNCLEDPFICGKYCLYVLYH